MDLVACYDSDESGTDKSKTPTKFKEAASKEVDVIEIDDSDTDVELDKTILTQTSKSSNDYQQNNPKTNNKETSVEEIECIDIDSDSEDESSVIQKDKTSPTSSKKNQEANKSISKKVDYLNLEGSDSEDEKQVSDEADVNKLLSSAAVLSNVPCGPEKNVTNQSLEISSAAVLSNVPCGLEKNATNQSLEISSAAVLGNLPYGPEKNVSNHPLEVSPVAVLNNVPCSSEKNVSNHSLEVTTAAVSSNVPFVTEKITSNQSLEDISSHRNKLSYESQTPNASTSYSFDSPSVNDIKIPKCDNIPAISTEGIVNKRFKREATTPIATSTENVESEECGLSSYMYRKDERIIGAFAKSVACRLPRQITRHLVSHVNSVTALQWCIPQYSHLLLSASADCTVKIWDMYCKNPIQTVKDHLGLKAAKWSLSGEQVIIGGYGKKARVFDVLSGKEIISYDIFNYVHSIEIHPYIEDLFLCGTKNAIFGFDLRVNSTLPIRTYLSKCEEVLDIAFLDENEFICSTNVVSHDSSDRTIMVWDFSSGAIMSNQIFLERYTCPSLKVHPHDSSFIAQTNGDYIAAFSSVNPYKIKDKRYMGHKVSGFGVECDISPDGKYIASGDANGDVYFYNYSNTNIITKLKVRPNMATNRLKWHPALNSTLATATWDGHIQIWK